jgi:hypothetical protein
MSNKKKTGINRSRNFGGHLNKNWIERDLPRYQITYGCWQANDKKSNNQLFPTKKQRKRVKVLNSYCLEKIILHSSSGRLLQSPSNSTTIDLAFSTVGCQTPTKVYSRKSIAGFKLSKFALLGAKTTLRNLAKYAFFYKFYFLGAGETNVTAMTKQFRITFGEQKYISSSSLDFGCGQKLRTMRQQSCLSTTSLPIKNVFLFNELDSLDYEVFSNMTGFEIAFINEPL